MLGWVAPREPQRHDLKGTHPMGSRKKIGCLKHFRCINSPVSPVYKSLLSSQWDCCVKLVRQ